MGVGSLNARLQVGLVLHNSGGSKFEPRTGGFGRFRTATPTETRQLRAKHGFLGPKHGFFVCFIRLPVCVIRRCLGDLGVYSIDTTRNTHAACGKQLYARTAIKNPQHNTHTTKQHAQQHAHQHSSNCILLRAAAAVAAARVTRVETNWIAWPQRGRQSPNQGARAYRDSTTRVS